MTTRPPRPMGLNRSPTSVGSGALTSQPGRSRRFVRWLDLIQSDTAGDAREGPRSRPWPQVRLDRHRPIRPPDRGPPLPARVTRRQGVGADLIDVVAVRSAGPDDTLGRLDGIDVGDRFRAGSADAVMPGMVFTPRCRQRCCGEPGPRPRLVGPEPQSAGMPIAMPTAQPLFISRRAMPSRRAVRATRPSRGARSGRSGCRRESGRRPGKDRAWQSTPTPHRRSVRLGCPFPSGMGEGNNSPWAVVRSSSPAARAWEEARRVDSRPHRLARITHAAVGETARPLTRGSGRPTIAL